MQTAHCRDEKMNTEEPKKNFVSRLERWQNLHDGQIFVMPVLLMYDIYAWDLVFFIFLLC